MLQRSAPSAFATLSSRLLPAAAALMGAVGVALGALSAHREGAANLAIAAAFLLVHAPAILALAALAPRSRLILAAQFGMAVGATLFSGALALNVLAGIEMNPSPAPLGGVMLILGWILASAALLANSPKY